MAENNKIYITANELAEMLGVSVGHAYKLIRKLNQRYFCQSGRDGCEYFYQRSAQRPQGRLYYGESSLQPERMESCKRID